MQYACFKDKVALITGGTRGIGRQIAEMLADSGCSLAIVYRRDRVEAQNVENEIIRRNVGIRTIKADIADENSIPEIIAEVDSVYGKLDYLVSNAVFGVLKPIGEFTGKRFDVGMNANARAYLLLAQAAADLMVPEGVAENLRKNVRGPLPTKKRIVAMSSLGSVRYIPGYAGVGASKAAIETLTRYLAVELAPRGIGVNAVSGGIVDTRSIEAFSDRSAWIDERIEKTPLGRIGRPDDIAKVVVWLLSDQAEWITGQTIVADGGLSLI